MNLNNLLVTKEESQELYECQNTILTSTAMTNEEKLIRIAIVQTLSPVEDWESAANLLKENISTFCTFNLLISAFIALKAFQMVRYRDVQYFISIMDNRVPDMDDEALSVANYIKAEYIIETNGEISEAISLLNQSVMLCPKFVMHYIALSKHSISNDKKNHLKKASENVKNTYNAATNIELIDLVNPVNFFNEWVTKIDMNEDVFHTILSKAVE